MLLLYIIYYKASYYTSQKYRYSKHIVNLDRIKGYNGVNLKYGYSVVEIRTPKELLKYDKE